MYINRVYIVCMIDRYILYVLSVVTVGSQSVP